MMMIESVTEKDLSEGEGVSFLYSPDRVAARTRSEASE